MKVDLEVGLQPQAQATSGTYVGAAVSVYTAIPFASVVAGFTAAIDVLEPVKAKKAVEQCLAKKYDDGWFSHFHVCMKNMNDITWEMDFEKDLGKMFEYLQKNQHENCLAFKEKQNFTANIEDAVNSVIDQYGLTKAANSIHNSLKIYDIDGGYEEVKESIMRIAELVTPVFDKKLEISHEEIERAKDSYALNTLVRCLKMYKQVIFNKATAQYTCSVAVPSATEEGDPAGETLFDLRLDNISLGADLDDYLAMFERISTTINEGFLGSSGAYNQKKYNTWKKKDIDAYNKWLELVVYIRDAMNLKFERSDLLLNQVSNNGNVKFNRKAGMIGDIKVVSEGDRENALRMKNIRSKLKSSKIVGVTPEEDARKLKSKRDDANEEIGLLLEKIRELKKYVNE